LSLGPLAIPSPFIPSKYRTHCLQKPLDIFTSLLYNLARNQSQEFVTTE
jgi:hypothetical protein